MSHLNVLSQYSPGIPEENNEKPQKRRSSSEESNRDSLAYETINKKFVNRSEVGLNKQAMWKFQ
jgi:hypothetical protein